jgi:hypothetical protein
MKLYRAIDVWKRINENEAVCFRCFQVGDKNAFCVQSSDFYRIPIDKKQFRQLEVQYIELFIEEDPDIRAKVYPTLKEAIETHERDFKDMANEVKDI